MAAFGGHGESTLPATSGPSTNQPNAVIRTGEPGVPPIHAEWAPQRARHESTRHLTISTILRNAGVSAASAVGVSAAAAAAMALKLARHMAEVNEVLVGCILRAKEKEVSQRPCWFVTLAIILLLWAIAGVASFAGHVFVGEKMAAEQGAWDLAYYRALPGWFSWDYAIATLAGLAGAFALLMRSGRAVTLYVVSLVGVVIQFGYVFLGTDLMTHKGAVATVPFPAFIALMGGVQIAVARMAAKRGWIS